MTPQEYLAALHLALVESPLVAGYTIVRQRASSQFIHLRVRIDLSNGDFLEAAEFVGLTPDGIRLLDYRHQWMNGERTILRKRWDSTPHYPHVPNAPHHCHNGSEEHVVPSDPMTIIEALAAISRETGATDE